MAAIGAAIDRIMPRKLRLLGISSSLVSYLWDEAAADRAAALAAFSLARRWNRRGLCPPRDIFLLISCSPFVGGDPSCMLCECRMG